MDSTLTLGEYLRHLRRRKGWNLQQLAHDSGLSVSHLSRLENDNGLPNAETVVKLSTSLDGDLEQMLQLADCLPAEILDRLLRSVGGGASQHRRSAGGEEMKDRKSVLSEVEEVWGDALAKYQQGEELLRKAPPAVRKELLPLAMMVRDNMTGLANRAWIIDQDLS